MKGQLNLEFLVITFILITYLSTVFILFSSAKSSLTHAVDQKTINQLSQLITFINQRPEGSTIKSEIKPFPGRTFTLYCDALTKISTPSEAKTLNVFTSCTNLNISKQTCLSFEKTSRGVKIEIC